MGTFAHVKNRIPWVVAGVWLGLTYVRILFKQWLVTPLYFDFQHQYLMAQQLMKGVNIYGMDPGSLDQVKEAFRIHENIPALTGSYLGGAHSPLFYLGVAPLTWVSFHTANGIWLILNHVWLGLAVGLVMKQWEIAWTPVKMALVAAIVLAAHPLWENMLMGQSNTLALFLLVLSLVWIERGRDVRAGVCLAVLILIKEFYALMFLWLVWKRYYRAAGSMVLSFLVLKGVEIGMVGWGMVGEYIFHMRQFVGLTYAPNFSLPTLFQYLGMEVQGAVWLWMAIALGVIGFTLSRLPRQSPDSRFQLWVEWWMWVVMILMVIPFSQEHYLVVLAAPFLALVFGASVVTVPQGIWLITSWWLTSFGYWTPYWGWLLFGRLAGLLVLWRGLTTIKWSKT